jgi:hypothetical protein
LISTTDRQAPSVSSVCFSRSSASNDPGLVGAGVTVFVRILTSEPVRTPFSVLVFGTSVSVAASGGSTYAGSFTTPTNVSSVASATVGSLTDLAGNVGAGATSTGASDCQVFVGKSAHFFFPCFTLCGTFFFAQFAFIYFFFLKITYRSPQIRAHQL